MNIDILNLFSAGSANDHNYKHLWVKGASLFIPQINELLKYTNYEFQIINIEEFMNDDSNILGKIFEYNKSDKSTSHNYHILYSYILNKLDINKNLNIFEVGLGTNNPDLISTMSEHGRPGASLFSFRVDLLVYLKLIILDNYYQLSIFFLKIIINVFSVYFFHIFAFHLF